jgi:hypothetical protein
VTRADDLVLHDLRHQAALMRAYCSECLDRAVVRLRDHDRDLFVDEATADWDIAERGDDDSLAIGRRAGHSRSLRDPSIRSPTTGGKHATDRDGTTDLKDCTTFNHD